MKVTEQRGVVLIVVLWITILLTVLLVAFTTTIKVDRDVASDIVQRVQARAGAEAVLSYLVAVRKVAALDWLHMAGQVYKLELNSTLVRFRFVPETAFVSLNAAPLVDLERLFSAAGAKSSMAIAEHIVQRREGGIDVISGEEIRPQPWVSTAELAQVPNLSPEIYQRVQGWFTADSKHTAVELKFAEVDLIQALLGDDAERFIAEQAAQESQPVTSQVIRVQVELGNAAHKRKVEASVMFGLGELGYRIVRWNEYNAHFSLE